MSIGQEWLYERSDVTYAAGQCLLTRTIQRLRITGETPRKWVAKTVDADGRMIWGEYSFPKKGGQTREARSARGTTITIHETEASLMDARAVRLELAWAEQHRWGIRNAVGRCSDPGVLRQVAALVGYKEPA